MPNAATDASSPWRTPEHSPSRCADIGRFLDLLEGLAALAREAAHDVPAIWNSVHGKGVAVRAGQALQRAHHLHAIGISSPGGDEDLVHRHRQSLGCPIDLRPQIERYTTTRDFPRVHGHITHHREGLSDSMRGILCRLTDRRLRQGDAGLASREKAQKQHT